MRHSGIRPSLWATISAQRSTHHCISFVSQGLRKLAMRLSHSTQDCTLVSDPDPDITTQPKTLESAVLAMTSHPSLHQGASSVSMSPDACCNWNAGKCQMTHCCYKHICRVCGGPNPAYARCDCMLGPRSDIVLSVESQRSLCTS